jgi:hypothetical protein
MHLEKGQVDCKAENVLRTGSVGEAYVERGRIRVERDERRTVVGQRIFGQGLALGSAAPRRDDPSV